MIHNVDSFLTDAFIDGSLSCFFFRSVPTEEATNTQDSVHLQLTSCLSPKSHQKNRCRRNWRRNWWSNCCVPLFSSPPGTPGTRTDESGEVNEVQGWDLMGTCPPVVVLRIKHHGEFSTKNMVVQWCYSSNHHRTMGYRIPWVCPSRSFLK